MNYLDQIILGDCISVMSAMPHDSIASCITDPPYNYEFIGRKWDDKEINRRLERIKDSKTLVKNIPYGSGLAGGVRNARWYARNQENTIEYTNWCKQWSRELFRVCKHGAPVAVFNSTRTAAHVQVALEDAGFYTRDVLVYRRHSGIPKGLNLKNKLEKMNILMRKNGMAGIRVSGTNGNLLCWFKSRCLTTIGKHFRKPALAYSRQSTRTVLFSRIFSKAIIINPKRDSRTAPSSRWS